MTTERRLEIHSVNHLTESEGEEGEVWDGQAKLWEITFGVVTSMVLKAAVLLDIPGIIARDGSKTGLSVAQIASQLPSKKPDTGYLFRILRFLASRGVLSETKVQASSGRLESYYGINNVSRWLVRENELCLAPQVLMQLDQVLIEPYHHIHESVHQRRSPFLITHGVDVWKYAKSHPEFNKLFNDSMACYSRNVLTSLLASYDGFKHIKRLVDVGGGVGLSLSMISAAYPQIECINFDLPQVVATAPEIPGVQHVGGDMFESIPTGDAIFMKSIMHDWSDGDCIRVLNKCWEALKGDGRVIIVEAVLEEGGEEVGRRGRSSRPEFSDMLMLFHTEGGVERGKEEWEALFHSTPFHLFTFTKFNHTYSLIQLFKPDHPPPLTT